MEYNNLDLEQENEKQLRIDEASYEMYEKTKRETVKKMKEKLDKNNQRIYSDKDIEKKVKLISEAQEAILEDYQSRGGDIEKLKNKGKKPSIGLEKQTVPITEQIKAMRKEQDFDYVPQSQSSTITREVDLLPDRANENVEMYDMVPLPSKGECYRSKIGKVPVAYLTAFDENMIVSPNLYRDNMLIDTMLKHKVLNDVINPKDMLEGDREAIILFLRANGYGPEYPITATDDKTGVEFDAVVDLSKIEFKKFTLTGDTNGWFDFVLPYSKKQIKFRFLTHQDNLDLKAMDELENKRMKKEKLSEIVTRLDEFIEDDNDVDRALKLRVRDGVRAIESWADGIDEESGNDFTNAVTNKLEMEIMSIDNITDRTYIHKFVRQMNVKDSSALRRYINDNEPGLDYRFTIEKPESLGGGSMDVFLQLDQFIFLNLA